jgi:choline-sulfatase
MGEHGWFQKNVFYDITCRVPMILAGPGVPAGERIDALTEAVDLGPTLARLCDVSLDKNSGRDLLTPHSYRQETIGETYFRGKRRAWIRTSEWAMDWNIREDGSPETEPEAKDGKLNNLLTDPEQVSNVYGCSDHAEIIGLLEKRFHERTQVSACPIQHPAK